VTTNVRPIRLLVEADTCTSINLGHSLRDVSGRDIFGASAPFELRDDLLDCSVIIFRPQPFFVSRDDFFRLLLQN
jgi:hypothetical protein